MMMDWMKIIEGLLFVSSGPLTLHRMREILDPLTVSEIQEHMDKLRALYEERRGALEVKEIAGGYQLYTRPEISPWVQKMVDNKPLKLSRASLETIAIIAYNQPALKSEIDSIRGVDSQRSIRTLMEKGLVRVIGRKEEAGRPLLYGTTRGFLQYFGLKDIASLPSIEEMREMLEEEQG